MNVANHPFTPETVMAYLDGELAPVDAATLATHLNICPDCSKVANDFRNISGSLAKWQVEDFRYAEKRSTLFEKTVESGNKHSYLQALIWATGIGLCCVLLTAIAIPNLIRSKMAANESSAVGSLRTLTTATIAYTNQHGHLPPSLQSLAQDNEIDQSLGSGNKAGYRFSYQRVGDGYTITATAADPSKGTRIFSTDETGVIFANGQPLDGVSRAGKAVESRGVDTSKQLRVVLIARNVELSLVVKDFKLARASLDALLQRHRGYAAQLTVSGDPDSGGSLQASLRIPVSELESAIAELKALGHVERESQSGEEVTMQHADLAARISNARETELRLKEILRTRTGKVSDVLEVEQQISQTRGEIERLEAELEALEKRVDFATFSLTLNTERKDRVAELSPSATTRIHNALISGYTDARETAIELVVWLLASGPQILLWLLVLGLPCLWVWRRWRTLRARFMAA